MSFVVSNEFNKYILDVIPHSNIIVEIRLTGAAPLTLINVDAPQAHRAAEDKDKFYRELDEAIQKNTPKGVVCGNGRLQRETTRTRQRGRSGMDRATHFW